MIVLGERLALRCDGTRVRSFYAGRAIDRICSRVSSISCFSHGSSRRTCKSEGDARRPRMSDLLSLVLAEASRQVGGVQTSRAAEHLICGRAGARRALEAVRKVRPELMA